MSGGGNNSFIKKRDERDQKFFDAGIDVGFQKCLDYVMNALRDPELVGDHIWGEKKLYKLNMLLAKYDAYFYPAWNYKHKDADIRQRDLDARLREGCGKYFAPFPERYPVMQDLRYDKPMKGWTE